MAETCGSDAASDIAKEDSSIVECIIKKEETPAVSSVSCGVCGSAAGPTARDLQREIAPGETSLYACLCQRLPAASTATHVCSTCGDLLVSLEQAELEYTRLKQGFELIISRNPFYSTSCAKPIDLNLVKNEYSYHDGDVSQDMDSEDEPLAVTKKNKPAKRKGLSYSENKVRTKKNKEKWECLQCGETGENGELGLVDHIARDHMPVQSAHSEVKTEEGDDDSLFSNHMSLSNGVSETVIKTEKSRRGRGRPRKSDVTSSSDKKKGVKVMHQCDHCNARFSSLARLQRHVLRHESKPPYICEVCGAHYKHRRACDIHIAMHKGISDWKCEECNKLFPSKGALQRHNNIHTGKANYQCEQCGKSFIHTSSFKMHKLAHSGVKPHACPHCGLQLMTSSHLKRHLRVHSGEKRYECTHCGKKFSERYNLIAHAKSHEPAAAPEQPLEVRKRYFRCHFCTERFERRYMLERHSNAAHGRAIERPAPTPRNTMSKLLKHRAELQHNTSLNAASDVPALDAAAKGVEVEVKQSTSPPAPSLVPAVSNTETTSAPPSSSSTPSSAAAHPQTDAWTNTDYTRLHYTHTH